MFNDKVPDRTTLVKLRKRWGKETFDNIMDNIVGQCIAAGLVDGHTVTVDGTQVVANASIKSFERLRPELSVVEYNG